MKLRTQLFLGVGILLFLMSIIMYFLPAFLVKKDVEEAALNIHDLLVKDHQQLIKSQQLWLEDVITTTKQDNDALLVMLYEDPKFSEKLIINDKNSLPEVWKALSRVAGYSPSVGFVQAHSPEINLTAAITPSTATLYPVTQILHANSLVSISFGNNQQSPLLGVALSEKDQEEEAYKFYVLINPKDENQNNLKNFHYQFAEPANSSGSSHWSIKMEMVRVLTPFFAEGLSIGADRKVIPEGLALIDKSGNGYVLLSKEVFSTMPLFDDVLYYTHNQPVKNAPSVAKGAAIIALPALSTGYIGNTLRLRNTYFSVGSSLDKLAEHLALSSNKMVLLKVNQNFWMGFNGDGVKLSADKIKQAILSIPLEKNEGEQEENSQKSTAFARVCALEKGNLIFYDFHPLGKEDTIANMLLSLENRLSNRISLQLFMVTLATMVLILMFIARIVYAVIYPVTKLAQATQFVVAGRYGEVVLPDVDHRQDEVAILTRSFGDMVSGLEEREKIRGVLDKVVSKDVADEILRTQIHLGGEDRIVTMLFCDVRDFTQITAGTTPQNTIQMLNACMTKVSHVIEGEGGIIDKYVGDEVMAIYGAPAFHPDHALRAVSSGLLIIESLKKWNLERVEENKPPLEMGIGIHTGLVVVGNMGAEDRLNYTVLGANVNLASRLCEAALPNQLIISEETLAEPNIRNSFQVKPLQPISLKGFAQQIKIYEVTGFKWS